MGNPGSNLHSSMVAHRVTWGQSLYLRIIPNGVVVIRSNRAGEDNSISQFGSLLEKKAGYTYPNK